MSVVIPTAAKTPCHLRATLDDRLASPEAVQQNDQRPVAGRRQCNRSRRPGRYGGLNNWAILVLVALAAADGLDTALRAADEILAAARRRGAALAVASTSAMRA
jgi:hypothetical protein